MIVRPPYDNGPKTIKPSYNEASIPTENMKHSSKFRWSNISKLPSVF